MIRYALLCDQEDAFEGWFASSAEFERQAADGALVCPMCGSSAVRKAVMAPAVRRAGRERARAIEAIREKIRSEYDYVGERFPEEARKRAAAEEDGDAPSQKPIWGEASPAEARALIAEGVPVAPLPPALAPTPPRKLN